MLYASFFNGALQDGQRYSPELGYVRVPAALRRRLRQH